MMIDKLLVDHPDADGALLISTQAVLAASAGNHSRAEASIELAILTGKVFGNFHHAAYHIAIAFALMSRTGQAVEWLIFAANDGFPCYPLFEDDFNFDGIRQHARTSTSWLN